MEIILFEITQNKNFMIGQTLQNRYQIISELVRTAFGLTYLAKDLHFPGHPKCEVKQIYLHEKLNYTIHQILWTEANIISVLNHNQIPKLFAIFQENNHCYMIQEYIEGEDLSKEFQEGKKYSETDVITFFKELLPILVYVHENNIIHRDIKPANIRRRKKDNKLVLIDFGASTKVKNEEDIVIGTPGYMAPEQMRGYPHLSSDIYALGITAIQFLSGIYPQQFNNDMQVEEVIWQDKVKVSNQLANILNKMVRSDVKDRYQNAELVLKDVEKLVVQILPTNIPITVTYLVEPKFDNTGDFSEGLARVKIGNKWGYIDKNGNQVIDFQFDDAGDFSEGLAWVKIGEKYGYIRHPLR